MKIVQSTWFPNENNIAGRWGSEKSMLFNLALSYTTLRKIYNDIDLHTDSTGYNILVKDLGFQYSNVVIDLGPELFKDTFNFDPEPYWVLRKLHTYARQQVPFIHVDNDVYLFQKFGQEITTAPLCAQNIEVHDDYANTLKIIQKTFDYVPDWLMAASVENCHAVNAGILGGNNHALFSLYYKEATDFLRMNSYDLHRIEIGSMNVFLEQCMLKIYADYTRQSFKYQINFVYKDRFSYNLYKIHDTPKLSSYIHVMSCKANPTVQEATAKTLFFEDEKMFMQCKNYNLTPILDSETNIIPGPYSSSDEENLRHHFYRTIRIAKALSNAICLELDSLTSLKSSISLAKTLVSQNFYEILLDVFYFEHERYKFGMEVYSVSKDSIYRDFAKAKRLLDGPLFMTSKFHASATAKMITTRWLWVQRNEFEVSSPDNFESNITKDGNHFENFIYYYPEQEKLKEQELDSINSLVYRFAMQGQTVKEIFDSLKQNTYSNTSFSELKTVFESRIRYLVHQGALTPIAQI